MSGTINMSSSTHHSPTPAAMRCDSAADVPPTAPRGSLYETAWYHGQQQPVQIGVYARLSLGGTVLYSLWDGATWRWNCRHPVQAARAPAHQHSLVQQLPWRGLAQPAPQGYGLVDAQRNMGATC